MNIRPPRVTPEEHAAFNAEMPKLRHVVHKVKRERLKYGVLTPLQRVQELKLDNTAALERLNYWDKVLRIDSTREIRAPVRLWDSLNKIRVRAELNKTELNYYIEQHTREMA